MTYDDWKTTDADYYGAYDFDPFIDRAEAMTESEDRAVALFAAILLADSCGQLAPRTRSDIVDELESARDDIAVGEGWDDCLAGLADTLPYAAWASAESQEMAAWLHAVKEAARRDYESAHGIILGIEARAQQHDGFPWRDFTGDRIGG